MTKRFFQAVKNLDKFGPVTNDTVVIIIQVNSNCFLSYPSFWCTKKGKFLLLLLNIVVVIRCRRDRAIFSYVISCILSCPGAQQRGLPASTGQLSERCSPHREHSARLQPRRLGRANKHSCQV